MTTATSNFEELDVSLRLDNPYSNGEIFMFPEGDVQLQRNPNTYTKSPRDRYFTVVQGDTLWSISHQAYGNSKYYWVIQEVNNIDFALELEPGTSLLIPDMNNFLISNP